MTTSCAEGLPIHGRNAPEPSRGQSTPLIFATGPPSQTSTCPRAGGLRVPAAPAHNCIPATTTQENASIGHLPRLKENAANGAPFRFAGRLFRLAVIPVFRRPRRSRPEALVLEPQHRHRAKFLI